MTNLRTTIVLEVYPSEDNGQTERFRRLYICFDVMKQGFKTGHRRVVGIDGFFLLKIVTKSQMLTIVARDVENMVSIQWHGLLLIWRTKVTGCGF